MAQGRTKLGRKQRPSASDRPARPQRQPEPGFDAPDHELENYLAALAPEESPETTGSGRRFGSAEVHQLRLPLMANERLKELAARRGVSPAALAREWVLQHLEQSEQPAPAPAWPQEDMVTPAHARPGGYEEMETDTEITIPQGHYLR